MDLIQPVSRLPWTVLEDLLSDSEGIFQIACQSLTYPFPFFRKVEENKKRTRFTQKRGWPGIFAIRFLKIVESSWCPSISCQVHWFPIEKRPVCFTKNEADQAFFVLTIIVLSFSFLFSSWTTVQILNLIFWMKVRTTTVFWPVWGPTDVVLIFIQSFIYWYQRSCLKVKIGPIQMSLITNFRD